MSKICPVIALSTFAALSACSPAAENHHAVNVDDGSTFEESAHAIAGKESGFVELAISNSASVQFAVFVTYTGADTNHPATCHFKIIEDVAGIPKVVEENDKLLACSVVSSAEMEKSQLSISVASEKISVVQQADKKNAMFELARDSDGIWLMRKVSFTYSESDPASGDIEVINEDAIYPQTMPKIRVSDFDAGSVQLVRKTVE